MTKPRVDLAETPIKNAIGRVDMITYPQHPFGKRMFMLHVDRPSLEASDIPALLELIDEFIHKRIYTLAGANEPGKARKRQPLSVAQDTIEFTREIDERWSIISSKTPQKGPHPDQRVLFIDLSKVDSMAPGVAAALAQKFNEINKTLDTDFAVIGATGEAAAAVKDALLPTPESVRALVDAHTASPPPDPWRAKHDPFKIIETMVREKAYMLTLPVGARLGEGEPTATALATAMDDLLGYVQRENVNNPAIVLNMSGYQYNDGIPEVLLAARKKALAAGARFILTGMDYAGKGKGRKDWEEKGFEIAALSGLDGYLEKLGFRKIGSKQEAAAAAQSPKKPEKPLPPEEDPALATLTYHAPRAMFILRFPKDTHLADEDTQAAVKQQVIEFLQQGAEKRKPQILALDCKNIKSIGPLNILVALRDLLEEKGHALGFIYPSSKEMTKSLRKAGMLVRKNPYEIESIITRRREKKKEAENSQPEAEEEISLPEIQERFRGTLLTILNGELSVAERNDPAALDRVIAQMAISIEVDASLLKSAILEGHNTPLSEMNDIAKKFGCDSLNEFCALGEMAREHSSRTQPSIYLPTFITPNGTDHPPKEKAARRRAEITTPPVAPMVSPPKIYPREFTEANAARFGELLLPWIQSSLPPGRIHDQSSIMKAMEELAKEQKIGKQAIVEIAYRQRLPEIREMYALLDALEIDSPEEYFKGGEAAREQLKKISREEARKHSDGVQPPGGTRAEQVRRAGNPWPGRQL